MSSILTNQGAMVALQTLNSVNKNLLSTQNEISTGKKVATAKDNASVWAIAQTMQSDVQGFKGISDSLAAGSAMVAVARSAAETSNDLLIQIKEKVIAAQSDSADTTKLQNDVDELIGQIRSVVGAAQFNGVNLVGGTAAPSNTNVLASIDRDSTGDVTASSITVAAQDLRSDAGGAAGITLADGGGGVTFVDSTVSSAAALADGDDAAITLGGTFTEGESISVTLGDTKISYTVTAEDEAATTPEDVVAVKLKALIEAERSDITVDYDSGSAGVLALTNNSGGDLSVTFGVKGVGAGGLADLQGFDVTSNTAIADIEAMITTTIDAAAAFGSSQKRIDIQSDFVTKLTDSLKAGIGAMVDANMEETSARLQALQVQQQLGIQSLSIANQAPQSVLSLFR